MKHLYCPDIDVVKHVLARYDCEFAWVNPVICDAPHRVSHIEKMEQLLESLAQSGWGINCPALIGYLLGKRVQLLSGSHRIEAARRARLLYVPVVVRTNEQVIEAWGDLEKWQKLMTAPLVTYESTEERRNQKRNCCTQAS